MSETQFVSPREIAERLSVKPVTVYAWIRQGRLPAVRLGPRCVRVRADDLDRFVHGAPPAARTSERPGAAPSPGPSTRSRPPAKLPRRVTRLFFDVDPGTVSPTAHARAIVERILESGDERDISWMTSAYPAQFVREVAETSRRLSPKSAAFWRKMMGEVDRHAS